MRTHPFIRGARRPGSPARVAEALDRGARRPGSPARVAEALDRRASLAARPALRSSLAPRRARRAALIAAAVLVAAAGPARADVDSWRLDLEGGSEYDTNVERLEVSGGDDSAIHAAPLARLGTRLRLAASSSARDRLALDAFAGAKLFATDAAQRENVAVVSADLGYQRRLGERKLVAGARASYYDALGTGALAGSGGDERNFRHAAADALLTVPGPGRHRLTAALGVRDFVYKADSDFDWTGQSFALSYRTSLWRGDDDREVDAASVDFEAGYRVGLRHYEGNAFTNGCPGEDSDDPRCFVPTQLGRVDLHHGFGAELVYTGDRIYGLRYDLQVNDSNSYGQSLVRQRLEASLTTALVGGVYLTARGVVRLNLFLDPLLLARDVQAQSFVSIEDENRNSLSLHLSRDLGEQLSLEARYAIYQNEFATEELHFRRQTFYVGMVYSAGSRP